jgi:signal peptidase I
MEGKAVLPEEHPAAPDGVAVLEVAVAPEEAFVDAAEDETLAAVASPTASVRGVVRELLSTVVPAVLMAVLMHMFLAQSTVVYGESMQPTFFDQQRLIMEKVTYRLRGPARGDVVVIKDPNHGPVPLIKRVIGLPGERVTVANGHVYIDGELLEESYVGERTEGVTLSWIVPPFHVFVMGDNRNNSRDSRIFGPVPLETILGHAIFRYWPLSKLGSAG